MSVNLLDVLASQAHVRYALLWDAFLHQNNTLIASCYIISSKFI